MITFVDQTSTDARTFNHALPIPWLDWLEEAQAKRCSFIHKINWDLVHTKLVSLCIKWQGSKLTSFLPLEGSTSTGRRRWQKIVRSAPSRQRNKLWSRFPWNSNGDDDDVTKYSLPPNAHTKQRVIKRELGHGMESNLTYTPLDCFVPHSVLQDKIHHEVSDDIHRWANGCEWKWQKRHHQKQKGTKQETIGECKICLHQLTQMWEHRYSKGVVKWAEEKISACIKQLWQKQKCQLNSADIRKSMNLSPTPMPAWQLW